MPIKISKDKANYRDAKGGRSCSTCVHYGDHSCSIVAGHIEPDMVSDLYKAKK